MSTHKQCTKCGIIKPFSSFYKKKASKNGLNTLCKICMAKRSRIYRAGHKDKEAEQHKKYYAKNRDEILAKQRLFYAENKDVVKHWQLVNKYGITLDEYNALFTEQEGCCAICSIHQSGLEKALGVDHDHKTGKVRQLLCRRCNSVLGYIDENIMVLNNMMQYLKKHKD